MMNNQDASAMKLALSLFDQVLIVEISGAVESGQAGRLYDVLTECAQGGLSRVIVDLTGVDRLTRAGARGLIVAAKLMRGARREMRFCGARPDVAAALRGTGFTHLLKHDPTLEAALAASAPVSADLSPRPMAQTAPCGASSASAPRLDLSTRPACRAGPSRDGATEPSLWPLRLSAALPAHRSSGSKAS